MKLIIVRHGESTENRKSHEVGRHVSPKEANPSITQVGAIQALVTGEFLKTHRVAEIWCSSLKRASETAKIIHIKQPGAEFRIMSELHEKSEREVGVRNSEALDEFIDRVWIFLRLLNECNHDLMIVGHSMFISVLTSLLLGETVQEPPIYRNPNCAITTFERQEGVWKMLEQGSVEHLPAHLRTGVEK